MNNFSRNRYFPHEGFLYSPESGFIQPGATSPLMAVTSITSGNRPGLVLDPNESPGGGNVNQERNENFGQASSHDRRRSSSGSPVTSVLTGIKEDVGQGATPSGDERHEIPGRKDEEAGDVVVREVSRSSPREQDQHVHQRPPTMIPDVGVDLRHLERVRFLSHLQRLGVLGPWCPMPPGVTPYAGLPAVRKPRPTYLSSESSSL
jgi:hypothetical protein